MASHGYPTTQEEEDMALALAISASLTEGAAPPPFSSQRASHTSRPAQSNGHSRHSSSTGHPVAPSHALHAGYPNPFSWPSRGSTLPIRAQNGAVPPSRPRPPPTQPPARTPAPVPMAPTHTHRVPTAPPVPAVPSQTHRTPASGPVPMPPIHHATVDARSSSAPPKRFTPWSSPPPSHGNGNGGSASVHLQPQRAVSPPPRPRPTPPPANTQQQPRRLHPTGCAGCGRSLNGTYINALGRRWHAECFSCAFCNRPIGFGGNIEFAVGRDDNWPYHLDCHRHKYHPVCHVCGTFIPERNDGRIEFKENPFWREKYCPRHQADGTPQCCSCSRFKPQADAEWVELHDARHLCLECLGSMLVDTKDAQPLYDEVLGFFRSMNMALPEKPPLFLVDGHVLNEYSSKEGGRPDGPIFHVRGLTLADIYRSIPTIRRVGGRNWFDVDSVSAAVVRTKCVVTGILVMYGLPRLLTGCIMAHELMHAFLRMNNVTGLDLQVEEGLCQLMALLWLDRQGHSFKKDQVQERLSSYFAFQIRSDPSPVYGEGFRNAFDVFQRYNGDLKRIVTSVVSTGRMPS